MTTWTFVILTVMTGGTAWPSIPYFKAVRVGINGRSKQVIVIINITVGVIIATC